MLVVVAELPVKPEHRADVLALLAPSAAQTRTEPGCLSYSFAVDIEDENRILSIETWTDQASLDTHMGVIAGALGGLMPLLAGAPSILSYETAGETKVA